MSAVWASSFEEADLDWRPLEQFVRAAQRLHPYLVAGDFMWMGVVELANGAEVHVYKHVDTRSYLRLDNAGHAYRDREGDFVVCETPLEAVVGVRLQSEPRTPGGESPRHTCSVSSGTVSESVMLEERPWICGQCGHFTIRPSGTLGPEHLCPSSRQLERLIPYVNSDQAEDIRNGHRSSTPDVLLSP